MLKWNDSWSCIGRQTVKTFSLLYNSEHTTNAITDLSFVQLHCLLPQVEFFLQRRLVTETKENSIGFRR